MKICTITLHCTDNCGSSLQAYALQKYLLNEGNETEIIDYCPQYLKYNGSFIKSIIRKILMWKTVSTQDKKNLEFRYKYLKLTREKYLSYKELNDNPPQADLFITGSDQVWNPDYLCGNDPAYYLNFVHDNTLKMSYAASLGKVDVPFDQKKMIINYVKDFSFISVREKSSQELLQKSISCPVEYVCDPVLLLKKHDYIKMESNPPIREKYILIYLVKKNELLDDLVQQLRQHFDAKVVLIYGFRDYCNCDYHIRDVSPTEFLGYINHAEYIVASSFHATVFSLIFEKQFSIVLPKANTARIEQMLELCGLKDKIIRTKSEIANAFKEIDYETVRPKLNNFIESSQKTIQKMMEMIK